MEQPTSHRLPVEGATLHYLRWGDPNGDKPVAVLTHGLGFVGATWIRLARELASDYTVYALDRRGHGLSEIHGSVDYSFEVFRRDLLDFLRTHQIHNAYGVGHSSGATDLLLAAGERPDTFTRILAFEPTVQDPTTERTPGLELTLLCQNLLERTRRRRSRYADRETAWTALKTRSPLKNWHDDILRAHVEYGFRDAEDGSVELCCLPTTEADMLVPIFHTMENRYPGSEFECLPVVPCPVRVIATDGSDPIYSTMAAIAARLVEQGELRQFRDVGHFWPQEAPDAFNKLVMEFARAT